MKKNVFEVSLIWGVLLVLVPLKVFAVPLVLSSDPPELRQKLPELAGLIMNGKAADALPDLKKLDRLYPDHANVHFLTGLALGKLGQNSEAVREEKIAVSEDPGNSSARVALGIALGNTGHFNKEVQQERLVLATEIKNESAWQAMGWAYASLAKWRLARESEEEAVRLNPYDDQAFMVLGISLAHLGFYQEGLTEELKAKKLNATDQGTLRAIAWISGLIAPSHEKNENSSPQTLNPLLAPDKGDAPQGAPGIIPQAGGTGSINSGQLRPGHSGN